MMVGITTFAMRWALGTDRFRPPHLLTPPRVLEKAVSFGAEVVQICENLRLDGLSSAELASLARHADDLQLTLEAGMCGSRLDKLRRFVEISKRLNAGLLRVVIQEPGWDPPLDEVGTALRELIPTLQAAGIRVAVENHSSWTPSRVARLIKAVDDPNVGACLDPINSITQLVGPAETVSTLAPLAVSAHVKDARAFREHIDVRVVGCPLGEGLADIPSMLQALRGSARDVNVLVESWMNRLEDEAATVAREEEWIRHGIAYMRAHA